MKKNNYWSLIKKIMRRRRKKKVEATEEINKYSFFCIITIIIITNGSNICFLLFYSFHRSFICNFLVQINIQIDSCFCYFIILDYLNMTSLENIQTII